ncbi:transcriptional regulator with XRE-family HTH domain [Bradyrhizobium sp. GM2.4]
MSEEVLVQARIKMVREAFGLSREEFGDRIGVSYTAVRNWETLGTAATFVPKDASLQAIETAFPGVTAHWLRTGKDPQPDLKALSTGSKTVGNHPNRDKVLEAIRELEKEPAVMAYRALLASVSHTAA